MMQSSNYSQYQQEEEEESIAFHRFTQLCFTAQANFSSVLRSLLEVCWILLMSLVLYLMNIFNVID
jgi:hypothetical protein